jgi:hypothetical protein
MSLAILPGKSSPLGATVYPEGVNFCVYSKHASKIDLLLFADPLDPQPQHTVELSAAIHKTSNFWHVFIKNIGAGQIYGYRVYGEYNPKEGLRFDGDKVLLDPYARAIVGQEKYDRLFAINQGDNCASSLRAVVIDPSDYDWEGDQPINRDYANTIIYELHVGGLTRHPSSDLAQEIKGTYAGVIAKIPYFQQLGITAVELLPIHEFDPQDVKPGLTNYWGYNTVGFFAPHRAYSSCKDRFGAVNELGVFAITEKGLRGVTNPSAIFLSQHEQMVPGACVLVTQEGSRPLLVEIQALVDTAHVPNPRRLAVGLEQARLAMLLAVLHRHAGIACFDQDVFLNAVGGVKISEPAADLAVLLAIQSSIRNRALPKELIVFGEVGLAGEIRPCPRGQERLKEAAKLGFTLAIIPKANMPKTKIPGLKIIPVERIDQAIAAAAELS